MEEKKGAHHLIPRLDSRLRIALFGNQGHASRILQALLARDEQVVALCTKAKAPIWRRAARSAMVIPRYLGLMPVPFIYQEPLAGMPNIHRLAWRNGIEILSSRDLHKDSFLKRLSVLQPDLILCAGFHRLIPDAVLKVAANAAINLHPSLLPKHRGGTPNRWTIRLGDEYCGVTAHRLASEFDTGDIIIQRKMTVAPAVTWGELELKVNEVMESIALEIVQATKSNCLHFHPQDQEMATYETSYGSDQQWIDWSQGAWDVRRTCLAIRPKSGGFSKICGIQLCLWEVEVCETLESDSQPGTIIELDASGRPIVICGEGAVRIVSMLERGRIRPAERVLGPLGVQIGGRFVGD